MKKVYRLTAAACIFATALLMGASGGCGTALHKATVASGAIGATLHTAATANHNSTLETTQEKAAIAQYIDATAKANDVFVSTLTAANQSGGTLSGPAIVAAFQNLVTTVSDMGQGVFHLSNPQAQADFSAVIATVQANLAIIQGLVGTPTSNNGRPAHSPSSPFAALVLTAEEIEELISLAIAAGSTLIPKLLALRGTPDAQILLNAAADDAAAEQIAEGDEGASANPIGPVIPLTPQS